MNLFCQRMEVPPLNVLQLKTDYSVILKNHHRCTTFG